MLQQYCFGVLKFNELFVYEFKTEVKFSFFFSFWVDTSFVEQLLEQQCIWFNNSYETHDGANPTSLKIHKSQSTLH